MRRPTELHCIQYRPEWGNQGQNTEDPLDQAQSSPTYLLSTNEAVSVSRLLLELLQLLFKSGHCQISRIYENEHQRPDAKTVIFMIWRCGVADSISYTHLDVEAVTSNSNRWSALWWTRDMYSKADRRIKRMPGVIFRLWLIGRLPSVGGKRKGFHSNASIGFFRWSIWMKYDGVWNGMQWQKVWSEEISTMISF